MELHAMQRWVTISLAVCAFGVGGVATRGWRAGRTPAGSAEDPGRVELGRTRIDLPEADVFARAGENRFAEEVNRYRLAGTFQTYEYRPEEGGSRSQHQLALVDDMREGRQLMLRRGERLGPFSVQHIGLEHVVLARGEETWVLSLTGVLASGPGAEVDARVEEEEVSRLARFEDMEALETSPFGKRVGENQWVIDKATLHEYADQMIADPSRAIALYDSFTAVEPEDEEGTAGFQLQMAGEREFFGAMGLRDGDVIQRVNSMEMSSQARAEYMVQEFMQDRMGAVVMEVERGGQTEKLIYVIR